MKAAAKVVSDDRLIAFLYLALRDHLTPADVESMVSRLDLTIEYSNPHVAAYAVELAAALRSYPEDA